MVADRLAIELELDRIEAMTCSATTGYLVASWQSARSGTAVAPPLPAELQDVSVVRRLERWRALDRRAEMLWRWHAFAVVEGDVRVQQAAREWLQRGHSAQRVQAVVEARIAAAGRLGWSYYALLLSIAELDDARVERCGAAPEPAAALWPRARDSWWAVRDAIIAIEPAASRARLSQGAVSRTFPVDAPGDVRVVASSPDDLAHELGHAVYAIGHDASLPWSLRGAPARCAHEAVAYFFEALGRTPSAHRRQRQQIRVELERALYVDPGSVRGSDLEVITRTEQLICDPVAHPSYLVGQWLCEQMWELVNRQALSGAQLGRWLRERLFRSGAAEPWGVIFGAAGVEL